MENLPNGNNNDLECIMRKLNALEEHVNKYREDYQQIIINNRILRKEIKMLKEEHHNMLDAIYNIEANAIYNNQYTRRENIEFINIPETTLQKDLEPLVIKILNSMDIKIQSYDIVAVHRLGERRGDRPRNVIVRFVNRKNAIKVLRNKKFIKSTGMKFKINNLYVIENLCRENKHIFNKCYKLKKSGVISKVWTFNGVVNIQIHDTKDDEIIEMKHFDDIDYHLQDLSRYIPDSDYSF